MAAGSGVRMDSELPKQFIDVKGLPIVIHTYNKIKDLENTKFIFVLPFDNFSKWEMLIRQHAGDNVVIVRGGKERNLSVKNGINSIVDNSGHVAIHDGVRPFINKTFIEKLFEEAKGKGNAIPFTRSSNSMRRIDRENNFGVDRSEFVQIQTPQVFRVSELKKCIKDAPDKNFTDESSLFDEFNIKINLVEGLNENIKITTRKDLKFFD